MTTTKIGDADSRAHNGRSRTNSAPRRNFRREAMIDGAGIAIAIAAAFATTVALGWFVLELLGVFVGGAR
jgi:hypothetical protein